MRWNKGIMTTPENPGSNPLMLWIRDHVGFHGDECLIWPYTRARSGYGSYARGGKVFYVHRYMCEAVNGPPPTPKHHAAHSCGRGQHGCANPRHVSWKTNSENQLDRRGHKTNGPGALSEDQTAEIIRTKDTILAKDAAAQFGVSETTIRQIRAGKIGAQPRRRKYFTDDERAAIRAQARTQSVAAIAKEYGCGKTAIRRIRGSTHTSALRYTGE